MNILFVDKSKIFAGAEYSLSSLTTRLIGMGYNTLICADFPLEHHVRFFEHDCKIIYRNKSIKWWMGSDYSLRAPRGSDLIKRIIFSVKLFLIIKCNKIAICHFNLLRDTDRLDIFSARLAGCKVVGHVRALQCQARLHRSTIKLCNSIICTSDYVLSEIVPLSGRYKSRRIYDPIEMLPYSIDGINIMGIKSKFGIEGTKIVLSSVAILDPRKGHDVAIRALKGIVVNDENVILVIAGGSPGSNIEKIRLQSIINSLHLEDKVVFTGHINNINEIYAMSDIILALSKDGEAFGRVPLEAASAKRVVIATKMGATPEIVIDGETGILVEPDNHYQVANKIIELLKSKDSILSISEKAHKHVLTKFSSEIHACEVSEVYGSLKGI